MDITLSPQSVVTVEEVLAYLIDQGTRTNDQGLLKIHINGITALMLRVTNRDRLKWIDDDPISEYRNGGGVSRIWLKNAPIRKLVKVTLFPNTSTLVELDGPTEPAIYNDEMFFDPNSGMLTLKSRVFPEGPGQTLIEYESGFLEADPEYLGLKVICLDAIAAKWARWKNQKHGIASESRGESSVTYSTDDFTKTAMHELRRYRRNLFA